MCGRYTLFVDPADLMARFGLTETHAPERVTQPRYNIAPSQGVAVTFNDAANALSVAQWGLIPSWSKDPAIGYKMINARSETVTEKPSFRGPFKNKRCLIYASGFYEWRKDDAAGKTKTPMFISLKSGEPYAMAGLWDAWKEPNSGEWMRTCTILTTGANELLSGVHDRMPVILPREECEEWLLQTNPVALLALLRAYPAEAMRFWPVSTRVNSVRNDGAELVAGV